jgi:1-acyl-sn-glycerol-3-phosphate acyltransferase
MNHATERSYRARLRALWRAGMLGLALALCVLRFWLAHLRGPLTLERGALWLHSACSLVLAAMGIHYRVQGEPAARGLVVSNHLSYLDIVIYSAAMPCFFVSKAEVNRWPYFGKAARAGGTLFIDRSRRSSAEAVAAQISERLHLPVPILFFPEGTSTDGRQVRRFHARLFQPAVLAHAPVTAASIRYVIESGDERELCWHDDTHFLAHLWKTLGTRGFFAELRFGQPRVYSDRRAAATQTHDEIAAMRDHSAQFELTSHAAQ